MWVVPPSQHSLESSGLCDCSGIQPPGGTGQGLSSSLARPLSLSGRNRTRTLRWTALKLYWSLYWIIEMMNSLIRWTSSASLLLIFKRGKWMIVLTSYCLYSLSFIISEQVTQVLMSNSNCLSAIIPDYNNYPHIAVWQLGLSWCFYQMNTCKHWRGIEPMMVWGLQGGSGSLMCGVLKCIPSERESWLLLLSRPARPVTARDSGDIRPHSLQQLWRRHTPHRQPPWPVYTGHVDTCRDIQPSNSPVRGQSSGGQSDSHCGHNLKQVSGQSCLSSC